MIPLLKVKSPGTYSSIQDSGRFGYQRYGVPASGAMDKKAFNLGHYILGNKDKPPALEFFFGGQKFEVLSDHRIVLVGADLGAKLDGEPCPRWKTVPIYKGQVLEFTRMVEGSIAYLIPEGGFRAKRFLGSASVYPKGKLGTILTKEQILYANQAAQSTFKRGLSPAKIPKYQQNINVSVWRSPHLDYFTKDALDQFIRSSYTLKAGDRMGYLLDGPKLEFRKSSDLLSEATQFGTVQVPNSGQPIILMADAQTVGGYATIGKIAEDDLWKVAQLQIGGEITFEWEDENIF